VSGPAYATGGVVWSGKPSISVYVLLYGVVAAVVAAILVVAEVYAANSVKEIGDIFFSSVTLGSVKIPDIVEVVTVLVILVFFLVRVVGLSLYKAGHSYELHTDGMYVNRGIANLQNTFISAMAFSDARLIRSLGMRIVGRSTIIIEANDGRKFEMKMIKDGFNVQTLIRSNLSHPTVRIDKNP
jgi:hypothetical protein